MDQVFITEKKLYVVGELKNWAITGAMYFIAYYGLSLVMKIPSGNTTMVLIILLLLKAGDMLTQYHVSELKIDSQNKQLILILNSLMSGTKTKVYDLFQINPVLQKKTGWLIISNSSVVLDLYVNSRDRFRLTGRYGFSEVSMRKIDNEIKNSQT